MNDVTDGERENKSEKFIGHLFDLEPKIVGNHLAILEATWQIATNHVLTIQLVVLFKVLVKRLVIFTHDTRINTRMSN